MPNKTVVIADCDVIATKKLAKILQNIGYEVVATAEDGFDAIDLCQRHQPNLLITEITLPLLDGLSLSKIVYEEGCVEAVVLLTACNDKAYIRKANEVGVDGYLVKPLDEKSLFPCLELSLSRGKEIQKLKSSILEYNNKLEDRTILERASGKIMEQNQLTIKQAMDYMKDISQRKNIPMRRVAEVILLQVS